MFTILEVIQKKYDSGNSHDLRFSDDLETKLIREIHLAYISWMRNAEHLLNINSLQLSQLKEESINDIDVHKYRKPKIELYFEVTPRGKLIFEWCPAYNESTKTLDFKRFFARPIIGYSNAYPKNRLFDIDGFKLFYREISSSNSEVYLGIANSLLALYWSIRNILSYHFTIINRNKLVLNDSETVHLCDSKLKKIKIFTSDEVEQLPPHNIEARSRWY